MELKITQVIQENITNIAGSTTKTGSMAVSFRSLRGLVKSSRPALIGYNAGEGGMVNRKFPLIYVRGLTPRSLPTGTPIFLPRRHKYSSTSCFLFESRKRPRIERLWQVGLAYSYLSATMGSTLAARRAGT